MSQQPSSSGRSMTAELKAVLPLVGDHAGGWVVWAILGTVLLAGLDMLGVAAMLPLMQLFTGASTQTGMLGVIAGVLGTHDPQPLIMAVAALVATLFIVKSLASIGFRWWILGHTAWLTAHAATELLRRYVLSPFAVHRTRNMSEVFRNLGGSVEQTFGQVVVGLLGILSDILTIAAIALVLVLVSPTATLFAIVVFIIAGWLIQRLLRRQQRRLGEEMASADLSAWGYLMPGLAGFREARLTSSAGTFVDGYARARHQLASVKRKSTLISELPRYVLEVVFIAAIAGMASLLFATGTAEAATATLGLFAAAAMRTLPTLNHLMGTVASVRTGRVGLEILADEVRKLEAEPLHSEISSTDHDYEGDIVLDGVGFAYDDSEEPVLRSVSTVVEKGKTTAFVGSSGAGKSTLLDLLLGLFTPTSGGITCGGRSIFDDLPAWYSTLGVVPQDVYLLDDSLRKNIAFGIPAEEIDDERVVEAVRQAQLEELVAQLPEGYETRVGERGVRLSGGQRQRVGIARALYRRPHVLVLDEATSALDNATEHEISETIDGLRGSMTIILVAHRLSTVKHSDKLVFMSDGAIQAEGDFDAVHAENAEFARLVSLGRLL